MADIRSISDKIRSGLAGHDGIKAKYNVLYRETREITYEHDDFTLFRTLFDNRISISLLKNKKLGSVNISSTDDESIKAAIDTALMSSEAASEDEFFDIAPGLDPAEFHIGVYEPDIDKLMQRAVEFTADVSRLHKKIHIMQIILTHTSYHSLYRNTNNTEDETFGGYYSVVVEFAGNDGDRSTGLCYSTVSVKDLDLPFISVGSFEKDLIDAEMSLDQTTVNGKFEGDVIFTPACVQELLSYSLPNFVSDSVILDGTSIWLDKIGQKVAADNVTIAVNPWDERIVNHEVHTEDGFRSENYTLIENGVLNTTMASLYVHNKCGVERAKNSSSDIVMSNGDIAYEDMLKTLDRGLIVGSISCGAPTANGELSGVAKNSFYVENGRIIGAVMETMVSFNLSDMFKNIKEISKEVLTDGNMVVPYIKVGGIVISGK